LKPELEWIKKILREWDVADLIRFPTNAPMDEYDSEAFLIWEALPNRRRPGIKKTARIIAKAFESFMRLSLQHTKDIEELARQMLDVSRKHICPVCGKYMFSERNSGEVCPVCGWKDSEAQTIDYHLENELNGFSVKEHQLIHYLKNNEKCSDDIEKLYREYMQETFACRSDIELLEKTHGLVDKLISVFMDKQVLMSDTDRHKLDEKQILNREFMRGIL